MLVWATEKEVRMECLNLNKHQMIKIFSISPKNKLIIGLGIVFIIVVVLKIYSGTKIPPQVQPVPTQFPTITPIDTPAYNPNLEFRKSIEPIITNNYPLLDYIPYKTPFFSIDYTKPLTLQVVLVKDTSEVRQEVLDWIRSKGVDPSTHKIEWKLK